MVKTVLVIECVPRYNWYEIFKDCCLVSGEEVKVEQAKWSEISVVSYHDSGCVVSLAPSANPHPGTSQSSGRTIRPDFILFRTLCQHIDGLSHKNLLYAFQFSNIPSVNSLESIYGMLEKPWVYGELKKIESKWRKQGREFPLIQANYYPKHRSMVISPDFPCVVKIGPYHAGYGKIKVESQPRWDDVKSIVAINGDYCTSEEYVPYDYEVRIQKIGPSIRAFKRVSMNWKGNVGNMSQNEDTEVTDEFRQMIEAASEIFGGMDICALDLIHDPNLDRWLILELNGTAIGLVKRHEKEDMKMMRDLVISRLSSSVDDRMEQEHKSEEDTEDDRSAVQVQMVGELNSLRQELEQTRALLSEANKESEQSSGTCNSCLMM